MSLQYSGFQQSADRCFICGHLIMDMVSDNCFRKKKSHSVLEECIKSKTFSYLVLLLSSASLPSVRLVAERKSTKPFVVFFFFARIWSLHPAVCGTETVLILFSVQVEKWSLQLFHPFLGFPGQCLCNPGQKGSGSAVFPCCEAPSLFFLESSCGFPCTVRMNLLPCRSFVCVLEGTGPTLLGSRFDPECVNQFTSIQVLEKCSVDVWTHWWSRNFSLASDMLPSIQDLHRGDDISRGQLTFNQHQALFGCGWFGGGKSSWSRCRWCKTMAVGKKRGLSRWLVHSTPPKVF